MCEEILFNDALNTFYLRLYGVGHMIKNPEHPLGGGGTIVCGSNGTLGKFARFK